MKVRLDIRDGRGTLFCGTIEAASTGDALRMKLAELHELQERPFAALSAQAQPFEMMRQAKSQAPWKKKEDAA